MRLSIPLSESGAAVSFDLPAGWSVVDERSHGAMRLTAASPRGPAGRSLIVTVEDVDKFKDLREWQEGCDLAMVEGLDNYFLIDLEPLDVSGWDGVRRLAHYIFGSETSMTLTQCAFMHGGLGVAFTFTVPTYEYRAVAGELLASTESVEFR
jgi:hypothetical protein